LQKKTQAKENRKRKRQQLKTKAVQELKQQNQQQQQSSQLPAVTEKKHGKIPRKVSFSDTLEVSEFEPHNKKQKPSPKSPQLAVKSKRPKKKQRTK